MPLKIKVNSILNCSLKDTSFGPRGPVPNIKIQAKSKTSDNSSSLPTDTATDEVGLDDTLETGRLLLH